MEKIEITQEELNQKINEAVANAEKSANSKGKNEILKDMGFTSIEDGKSKLQELEALKTSSASKVDLTEVQKLEQQIQLLSDNDVKRTEKLINYEMINQTSEILKEMEVSQLKPELITKLIDREGLIENETVKREELQERVKSVIEDNFKDLIAKKENIIVGGEKKEKANPTTRKTYLDDKYKNNPWYKG